MTEEAKKGPELLAHMLTKLAKPKVTPAVNGFTFGKEHVGDWSAIRAWVHEGEVMPWAYTDPSYGWKRVSIPEPEWSKTRKELPFIMRDEAYILAFANVERKYPEEWEVIREAMKCGVTHDGPELAMIEKDLHRTMPVRREYAFMAIDTVAKKVLIIGAMEPEKANKDLFIEIRRRTPYTVAGLEWRYVGRYVEGLAKSDDAQIGIRDPDAGGLLSSVSVTHASAKLKAMGENGVGGSLTGEAAAEAANMLANLAQVKGEGINLHLNGRIMGVIQTGENVACKPRLSPFGKTPDRWAGDITILTHQGAGCLLAFEALWHGATNGQGVEDPQHEPWVRVIMGDKAPQPLSVQTRLA